MHQPNAISQQQGFTDIVRHEEDSLCQTLCQGRKLTLQISAREGIKSAKWFVQQQQRRFGSECAGNADSLSLSAGQLIRIARCKSLGAQTHERQQLLESRLYSSCVPSLELRDQGDVFRHSKVRKQSAFLDHVTGLAAQSDWIPLAGCLARNENFAIARQQQAIDQLERSRLATPRLAQ